MGEASVTVPTNETLLVVDGHSLAFRAFFALPVDNFSTSSGQATNAVWGFAMRCFRNTKAPVRRLPKSCSPSCH